jgi:MSHA biogenesis protein MshQ
MSMVPQRTPTTMPARPAWRALRRLGLRVLMLCVVVLALPVQAATYTFRTDTYAWETAANTVVWDRKCTNYPGDDDQATITLTGGFQFTFAGTAYSSLRVLANGSLQFGADAGFMRTYSNTNLPVGSASGNSSCPGGANVNTILGYWTDLNPSANGSGGVTWEQKGTAPNRRLVVSWNNVYQYATTTPYTFQIILFENGEFKYQYGNANASGSNATIGVQVNSSDYTLYAYNSGYNANGSAIRWFIPSGAPTLLADYRLDEYSWNGTPNEVADSTGNGYNGLRVGSAANVSTGYVCRAVSIPANTNTSSSAIDSSLDVDSGIGSSGSIALWVRSNVAWTSTTPAMLWDATTSSSRPFYLMRSAGGSLRFALSDSAGTALVATSAAQTFAANTWVHVTATWRLASGSNQSTLRLYVNGLLVATSPGTTNGNLDPSLGSLYIGDNRSSATPSGATANSANALLDEVQVFNYEISNADVLVVMARTHLCQPPLDHVEIVPGSSSASTCTPSALTLRACTNASCSALLTTYTGTVNLSTSSGLGDFATTGAPGGVFSNGTGNNGQASYTFASTDGGSISLTLSHSLAQDVTVTAVDPTASGSSRTSSAIGFRDNAFVFAEDLANKIAGSDIVVAGRPHDLTLSLIKKDPSTGSCGVATNYSGSRALKFWRSDSNGSWTAPSLVSPVLTIPAAQPTSNNLTLNFSAGVASFNLGTTDVGRYTLNALDDSLVNAATAVAGSSGTLTVRPFALLVMNLLAGSTGNPAGSAATDAVFTSAGSNFSATVAAYRWDASMTGNGADPGNTGTPSPSASAAALQVGGRAPGFAAAISLSPLAGSQTPVGGVLGNLNNGNLSAAQFTAGAATPTTLQYTEVGSFLLNNTALVSNYLGSGLTLDAIVLTASGTQNNRVGRFKPAGFVLANPTVSHRVAASCSPASTFSYLGETFSLGFSLTARNALGTTTQNYTGAFARLDPSVAANWNLAGLAGSTLFSTSGASPRLALGSASGSWTNGVASGISLAASASRNSSPDGPFTAQFGIAPVDADGVTMLSYDLDVDLPVGNDHSSVASVALLDGRLRLMNTIGSTDRPLSLPLTAQAWNGSAYTTNVLDSCSRLPAAAVSLGNQRKTLLASDTVVSGSAVTLANGQGMLTLAKPAAGHRGTVDVALSLGSTATDNSCLQSWTPSPVASAGANLAYLRGTWCGAGSLRDPSARATFGLYRGADNFLYQRENY